MFKKIKKWLAEKAVPALAKLGQVKVLQALSAGMVMILPLTLGAAIFSVLGSFPVPVVATYLTKIGLATQLNAVSNGIMGVLAMFITVAIAYNYSNLLRINAIISTLFTLATFLILSPQSITVGKQTISAFSTDTLGSNGIFVGMIIAIAMPYLYSKLIKNKHLVLKLPESVPPMVSKSFEPIFVGIIMLILVFVVRVLFSLNAYGDIFTFVTKIIAKPLISIGVSVPSLFFVYILANFLFFFGIHPNAVMSVITPILLPMMMMSMTAYNHGQALKYFNNLVIFDFMNNDGTGSTLSLLICVLIFCHSKRYRTFSKIALVPNIFNVNEPVIFGFPVMLNPLMFIPFVFSTAISGGIAFIAIKLGFITSYNPNFSTVIIPWTLPKLISSFLTMGWQGVVLRVFIMIVLVFVYYPFVKALDNQELATEREAA